MDPNIKENTATFICKKYNNKQLIQQQGNLSNEEHSVQFTTIKYKKILEFKSQHQSNAIAFNNSGSIMVVGCDADIQVWKIDLGKMLKRLKGHSSLVNCLVFSKKSNWFVSSSQDGAIRCWKPQGSNDWISSQPQKYIYYSINQIVLSNNEDQLIYCSQDSEIIVCKIDFHSNSLSFDYTLEHRHSSQIFAISLNESETALVSSSKDKQIILWGKGQDQRWKYQNHVKKDDYGFHICFISDTQIAWQQYHQSLTHIFEIINGKLKEQAELNIQLHKTCGGGNLFPTIFNKAKQVMMQKHNKYLFFIRQQKDGKFKVEPEPIDCKHSFISGALTTNGEYLVIWSYGSQRFIVYKINYGCLIDNQQNISK